MKEIVLIKYGGSIITDKTKPLSIDYSIINKLNHQIKEILQMGLSVIVGNGGGSFGHYYAKAYDLRKGIVNDDNRLPILLAKNSNTYLNYEIVNDLLKKGIPACSIRLSNHFLNQDYGWEEFDYCLRNGIVPVTYGDLTFLNPYSYCIASTEMAFLEMASRFLKNHKIRGFIICTNTDGVLDKNSRRIPYIGQDFNDWTVFWSENNVFDTTGGMYEKVHKSLALSKYAPVSIVDGRKDNSIIDSLNGRDVGTIIK